MQDRAQCVRGIAAGGIDHAPAGLRQGVGAGGAAHLIGHHSQGLATGPALAVQPQHGERKVAAHRTHHPAGAQDHAPAIAPQQLLHGVLAGGLAGAVHAQRIAGLLRAVGTALSAVEHEIGAHLQQAPTGFAQGLGEGARGAGIDGVGQLGLAFGLVHRGVSAAVEHPVRPVLMHSCAAGLGISQIERDQAIAFSTAATATGGDQLHAAGHLLAQSVAKLAGGAGEQHFHGNTSPAARASARLGAWASLPASSG